MRLLLLLFLLLPATLLGQEKLTIGSKPFTENAILGDLLAQTAKQSGFKAEHNDGLGGTGVLWEALKSGEIDAYVEYTGTLQYELFATSNPRDFESTLELMKRDGVSATSPFGFNNTYAIGIPEELAAKRNIRTISDLANHPDLKYGFTSDFIDREDGWRRLRETYNLPNTSVKGMEHALAYEAIIGGSIHVMDMYSTDAQIKQYNLRTLIDDKSVFPEYKAIIVYRTALEDSHPKLIKAFKELEGQISDSQMVSLNARVIVDKLSESSAAEEWLSGHIGAGGLTLGERIDELIPSLKEQTWQHLLMVVLSLLGASMIAIPLGFLAFRLKRLGQVVLALTGVLQTIPSIALLVLLIPLFGIGWKPAVIALFLYSLLPIVRSTFEGLKSIDLKLFESATAIGLNPKTMLFKFQLPLTSRSILSGVKIAAVINVGTATLGGLIGAGGYGQMIFSGIRRLDNVQILAGALCAAAMAIAIQGFFELAERIVIPKGLRLANGK